MCSESRALKATYTPEVAVSDGLPEMAESQQANASKKSRHFDYLTYFPLGSGFFPIPVKEKGWRDVRLCDLKSQSLMENITAYSSIVEFTKMQGRN